jgi:FkbM family methyltransferase
MSKTMARMIGRFADLATSVMKPGRRAVALALASERLQQVRAIPTARGEMTFCCPTARALLDPLNFPGDEPETVAWIDDFVNEGEVVWDIGANIGLYALYAALGPGIRVLAFEPGAQSFAALMRNIELNAMGDRIAAYCLAFDEATGLDVLHMMATGAGHSMHAFGAGEAADWPTAPAFSQSALGFSIDDFCRIFDAPRPDHVKLDVDGIEAKIIRGGRETLAGAKTVLVEIEDRGGDGEAGAVAPALEALGFRAADDFNREGARNQLFLNPLFLNPLFLNPGRAK